MSWFLAKPTPRFKWNYIVLVTWVLRSKVSALERSLSSQPPELTKRDGPRDRGLLGIVSRDFVSVIP